MPWARHGVRLKADAATTGLADESGEHQSLPTARILSVFCSGSRTRRPPAANMSDGQVPRPAPAVSAFLKEVVAAGGSAHIVTFARLGAINAPAVREVPAAAGERRARGNAAPHSGTGSPHRT